MEWYEEPWFISIIGILGVILTGVILALMVNSRHKDIQYTKQGRYEEHIKKLINKLHFEASRNGVFVNGENFFGSISQSTYKTQILDHLKTSEKSKLTNAYSLYNQIIEDRKKKNFIPKTEEEKGIYTAQSFELVKLVKNFDSKINSLHEKINHDIKPNFGFCRDCVENITTNGLSKLLKKRQLS